MIFGLEFELLILPLRKIQAGFQMFLRTYLFICVLTSCVPEAYSQECCLAPSLQIYTPSDLLQGSPASAQGTFGGCGGTITAAGGTCSGGGAEHKWSCAFTPTAREFPVTIIYTPGQENVCEQYRNVPPITQNVTLNIDLQPPTISVTYPPENAIVSNEEEMSGIATDDMQLDLMGILGGGGSYSFYNALDLPKTVLDPNGCVWPATCYYLKYYPELKSAEWKLPMSGCGTQTRTIRVQDSLSVNPHMTDIQYSFTVDCATPTVAILDPVADNPGLRWSNANEPVISGTADDDIGIEKIWLTIKDETANRWWDGDQWRAGVAVVGRGMEWSSTKPVTWKYTGLQSEVMRSGIFTITAYARDKVGRVGQAVVTGKNKKKYDLGEKEFAEISMRVTDVSNIGAFRINPYSFTSDPNENTISVTAEISPTRLSGILDNYVMWNVEGANAFSGTPNAPHGGNPSTFFVTIPPIIAVSSGRPVAMGYSVFPRVEYDFEGEHVRYEGADHGAINQDTIDKCRQEYIDMGKEQLPARTLFQLPPSPFYGGSCEVYIMLPETITAYNSTVNGVTFPVRITSAYRNPMHNALPSIKGATNSPHIYGRGLDLAPNLINCNDIDSRDFRAQEMQALFEAAPSPKLLEAGAIKLDPASTADVNKDGILDVFDSCIGGSLGADHVHIGSGNYY